MPSRSYESILPALGLVAQAVGNNLANRPDDVRTVKRVLEALNILAPQDDPVPEAGIMTDRIRQGIKIFQRDKGLPEDGNVFPDGETARQMDAARPRSYAKGETFGPPAPPQKPTQSSPVFGPYPPISVTPARKPELPILSKVSNKEVKEFIGKFEGGAVPHMYKDTTGNVTVGIGQMIPNSDAAAKLPFYKYENGKIMRRATSEEIKKVFSNTRKMPKGKRADSYDPAKNNLPDLRLEKPDVDKIFEKSLIMHSAALKKKFPMLPDLPPEAQKGLLDMMFNMGETNFNKRNWSGLYDALQKRDWDAAARESHRNIPHKERNDAVRDLFLDIKKKQEDQRSRQ